MYLRNLTSIVLALPILLAASAASAEGGGVVSLYDTDQNGYLDQTEFDTLAKSRRNRDYWTFGNIDADQDGRISGQELVAALQRELEHNRRPATS